MDDVELDPPNELIDTSCLPSTATSRCNSIGTLTSWQVLAAQLANQPESQEVPNTRKQPPSLAAELECSPRSASWTSGLPRIAPRPHHALYKEYRLLETIGKGAFGTVSIAVRRADGKQFVAKEIASGQAALASPKQREAIMDEVNVLAKMKHPNIVKYADCFMDANYLIIIMEYCNAGDLAGLIKRQAGQLMPEAHVMFLFVQICLAMHHVHAAGVLHRDLKTSNILANKPSASTPASPAPGRSEAPTPTEFAALPLLKLADFGVAKAGCDTDGSMAGTTVGTPHYLSPEMCDGKRYGKKTDVWALGCILYEIVCQRKAFEASNIGGIYRKIAAAEYNPLPDGYSNGLKSLVCSLLAKETKDRPSVAEILCIPYVRQHLGAYLDWARNTPEAQPEVLLASISQSPDGALSPRVPASRTVSQRVQVSPLAHAISSSNYGTPSGARSDGNIHGASRTVSNIPSSLAPRTLSSMVGQSGQDAGSTAELAVVGVQSMQRTSLAPGSGPQKVEISCVPSRSSSPTAGASTVAKEAPISLGGSECQPASCMSAAATLTSAQAVSTNANSETVQALPAATCKPNPFYSASAALAAHPDLQAAPTMPPAEAASLVLNKHKMPVGGGSYSLEYWASGGEPSSELIMAFRSSLDCSNTRRISSMGSSNATTPKSPLGQYMHSWQQDELQAEARQQQEQQEQQASTAFSAETEKAGMAAVCTNAAYQDSREAGSANTTRSTEEYGGHVTVPLPWLTAGPTAEPTKRTSADNWLSTLVVSLEQLQHDGGAASSQLQASTSPPPLAKQPSPRGFKAWDPSLACINNDSLAAAGLGSAIRMSSSSDSNQVPTSLEGWLSGDHSLMQHMHKRTSRPSRTSYTGGNLSPLGGSSGRAAGPSSNTFSWAPQPGVHGPLLANDSSKLHRLSLQHASAAAAAADSIQACSCDGAVVEIQRAAPGVDCGSSMQPFQSLGSRAPGTAAGAGSMQASAPCSADDGVRVQDPLLMVPQPRNMPCLSVSAPADLCSDSRAEEDVEDDLPLAVMVKQCLSGNSFLYTRSPSPVQALEHTVRAASSQLDSGESGTIPSTCSASSNKHAQAEDVSTGQCADKAVDKIFAEQQEALSRFTAFRAMLGISGGNSMHCPVVRCVQ